MTKQELIDALRSRRKLQYKNYFDAATDFENLCSSEGRCHIATIKAGERMETLNARIHEINEFILMLESLED